MRLWAGETVLEVAARPLAGALELIRLVAEVRQDVVTPLGSWVEAPHAGGALKKQVAAVMANAHRATADVASSPIRVTNPCPRPSGSRYVGLYQGKGPKWK